MAAPLADAAVDIATLAAEIRVHEEHTNPSVVKAIGSPLSKDRLRALDFTRATAPSGVMVPALSSHRHRTRTGARRSRSSYACRHPVLEQRERLEQLRAIEAGMRIDVTIVDSVPLGVDTQADLDMARRMLKKD